MNKAASTLGKLGKGIPKTISNAERKRRSERMAKAREKRWPKNGVQSLDTKGDTK